MSETYTPTVECVTLFERGDTRFFRTGEHEAGLYQDGNELKEETAEVVELDEPIPLGEVTDLACHSDRVNEWMQGGSDE